MTMTARRTNAPATAWEIPVAATCVWLATAALLIPAGRGVAAWAFGGGWVWPHGSEALLASITGLVSGNAAAGLDMAQAVALPLDRQVYAAIVLGELLLITATVLAVRAWSPAVGSGSVPGLASRTEAEAVLGVSQLRGNRALLRPDLYRVDRGSPEVESGVDDRLRELSDHYTHQGRTGPPRWEAS
ncbi:MAG: conjugal transfer protein [Actinomycetota bacterium]|nr:conjugal transfer protein [Actinomycetota bacterium]